MSSEIPSTHTNSSLSDEEYGKLIVLYINRLINEKMMSITSERTDGKVYLNIKFTEPTWYKQLDPMMRSNVFDNLQRYYKDVLIPKAVADMNREEQAYQLSMRDAIETDDGSATTAS